MSSKEFSYLVASRDPSFERTVKSIAIVKEFITANSLIIYGGSAIDYALRLRGDKIYPDELLSIPDLDFFSPNSVVDSYKLADILYRAGYESARAIVAQHIETMRVDAGDNHFIADITYVPPSIFDKIPTLTYNGMKIVHPDYQRIDLHSSLSFPFANPPREVIFDRWKKDIARFNLLAGKYPIEPPPATPVSTPTTAPDHKSIFTGFAAYAIIYSEFLRESAALRYSTDGVIPAKIASSDGGIMFDSDGSVESVHMNLEKLHIDGVKIYDPVINLLPTRAEYESGRVKFIIYELRGALVGVNSVEIGEKVIRFTGIQYTMKHFLSKHFVYRDQPRYAAVMLAYYCSLLKMVQVFDAALVETSGGAELPMRAAESVFYPSIKVYGGDNINLARGVAIKRLRHDIYGEEAVALPLNYNPARGGIHPQFDPVSMEFFHEEGHLRE